MKTAQNNRIYTATDLRFINVIMAGYTGWNDELKLHVADICFSKKVIPTRTFRQGPFIEEALLGTDP